MNIIHVPFMRLLAVFHAFSFLIFPLKLLYIFFLKEEEGVSPLVRTD